MEKKRLAILSSLTILALPLVSALDFEQAGNQLVDIIKQIFSPFFKALIGTNQVDQYFFARVLFLILVYAVVLIALKNIDIFKKNKGVVIIVSAIIAILSIRFLPTDTFLGWVLIPYGALSTAIIVLLPLIAYFFFVNMSITSSMGRRLAWILFALVFFGLWISRINELGGFSNLSKLSVMNWIYVAGIVIVGISFFFDRQIHRYFGIREINKWKTKADQSEIARLMAEHQNIAHVESPHAKKRRDDIVERLKELGASM